VFVLVLSLELLLDPLLTPLLFEHASMMTGAIAVRPSTFAVFFKKSFLSITEILGGE
jgi:hypothetical protein